VGARPAPPTPENAGRPETTFSETIAAERVTRLTKASGRVPPSRAARGVASTPLPEFVLDGDADGVRGRRSDVTSAVFARSRGVPQATLDLHRLTRAVARRHVTAFIAAEAARGAKHVLVVVGKGHHSHGGEGVLRTEIATWLSTGACAQHVLAFQSARADLGGSGAVSVLLSRS
jgi:DNA-nicking Smr family endonuclease